MKQYIIKGGTPLSGEVTIGGAKNAALGIIVAAIMADEPVTIDNLPDVDDVRVLLDAIESIGAIVERIDSHTVRINGACINDVSIDEDAIRKIRGSYYLVGALLGKYKKALVALPGGCQIGSRPIDQHIKGFEQLGAKVSIHHGKIDAQAENLVGTHIYLDCPSVGATINIMMAACMAEGKTIIENPAKEPHIVDVANFLNSMGANIKVEGNSAIIDGVKKLTGARVSAPDLRAGAALVIAGLAADGITVVDDIVYIQRGYENFEDKLRSLGAEIERVSNEKEIQKFRLRVG